MKGLLLQDYYLMKKNLMITGFMCMYFFIILLLGSGSANSHTEIDAELYATFGIITCFLTSCSYLTINHNTASKTFLFTHSYPIGHSFITLEKYLITYLLIAIGIITVSAFTLINHFVNNYIPGKRYYFIMFVILSAILIITHIELPVTIRLGQTIASGILIAVICLSIVSGLMLFIRIQLSPQLTDSFKRLENHQTLIVTGLLCIDTVTGILSFFVANPR